MHWLTVYVIIGYVIRACMVPVMLRRQFTPGASLAWLGIIFFHPYIGLSLYLLVGESRLGPGRIARHRELIDHYRGPALSPDALGQVPSAIACSSCAPLVLQSRKISRMPVLGGNQLELLGNSTEMVDRLVSDIDAATSHVHLLYYIFAPDDTGRRVCKALTAAAARGVRCRVLADAFASKCIFDRHGLRDELKAAGVEVVAALPTSPLRRRDLRDHRKLAVIDDRIAYNGSQNLINADYGGRRGGPWVDLTGRVTGPVVGELAVVFAEDWAFETNHLLEAGWKDDGSQQAAETAMQVVPTGPAAPGESYRRVLLGAVQSARHRLILTTPYFVPDDPTLVSLAMAADRGVDVTLIVPEKPDHFFTAMAGRAHYATLLDAGVHIFLYRPGLLHSKTVSVDDSLALFGSANLDVRSFNLNFELTLLAYGPEAAEKLRTIQAGYLKDSLPLNAAEWGKRPLLKQYLDRAVSLLSPLL